ncbi:hypothetical protein, partial [Deinococcus sp.]|uniref:hypothetical protein n=1 Tax=Deinococcus sp. TaxID=47478 RepID=UPI0025F83A47
MSRPESEAAPPLAPLAWPLWRRWLLNFGTVYLGLYFLLIGQTLLPVPSDWRFAVAHWFSRVWSGAALLPTGLSGSGDTAQDWLLLLLGTLLSLLLATLWTVSQRWKPGPSPRALSALSIGLRAALVIWLLAYGSAKFNFAQFGLLAPGQMNVTYGDSSPMGLLWRFMALSPGYQYLAGVAETLPALLL